MEALEVTQQPEDLEFREELPEIQNRTHADFAMQRLAECEQEETEVKAQLKAAAARLAVRADRLILRARRGQNYFRMLLETWANANKSALLRGKAKSITLLHGRAGWRKHGGGLKVTDKEALSSWLSGNPSLARVKYEPDMRALNLNFQTAGEVPPGMEPVPEEDVFYADATAPENALSKE